MRVGPAEPTVMPFAHANAGRYTALKNAEAGWNGRRQIQPLLDTQRNHCERNNMKPIASCLIIAALSLGLAADPADAAPDDLKVLLKGVSEVAAPGWPGMLCVFGDDAFTVIAGNANGPIQQSAVAASRLGKGRIVAFGHGSFLLKGALETGQTSRLMLNAVRWLAGKDKPRVAVQSPPDMIRFLKRNGIAATVVAGPDWAKKLKGFDVLVTDAAAAYGREEAEAVAGFVRKGGGYLGAECAWGWLSLNPGKSLTADFGSNRIVAPAGLVWTNGGLARTSKLGFAAGVKPSPLIHAGRALDAIEAHRRGAKQCNKHQLAQASWSVTHAGNSLPEGDAILRPRLQRLRKQHAKDAVAGPTRPLKVDRPIARLALAMDVHEIRNLPAEKVKPHPSGDLFPGAVPADAPRVERTLKINTAIPNWHSTGLYAAPGEIIDVRVPAGAAAKGLQVRIGCHTDGIWQHSEWRRAPEIARVFPINTPATKAANAFGGLVYVDVPANCPLGTVNVTIKGAVEAPRFILGVTTPQEWRETIRKRPAPWAELESGKVILTVPSKDARKLDNPVALMEFWVSMMDACNELLARPLDRGRPGRYVADTQISNGYMHAGYPIMTHLDAAEYGTDLAKLLDKGSWGHFHEMGHNHQRPEWTFDGTGEVTCNLFSLYIGERCCGITGLRFATYTSEKRKEMTKKHLAAGAPFDVWKRDPFLALTMYVQLQEAFGWETYKKVFAAYDKLPAERRPKTDAEKRDLWLVTFSRTAGRNLGPFYQAWGVPTSEKARASIKDLPVWMPPDFPPKKGDN